MRYERSGLESLLSAADVLAVIGFGTGAPAHVDDPRYLHVPLQPVAGSAPFEVWRSSDAVRCGGNAQVRWAGNGDYTFAAVEIDEAQCGGIAEAARHAYRALDAWIGDSTTPHVLRIWNYLDAINAGDGDAERYREFCRGPCRRHARRVRPRFLPAATAIGVRTSVPRVYWIAARARGGAGESASAQRLALSAPVRPSAPTFARGPCMRRRFPPQLYISGTAAIVGHASHHHGDFAAQVDENAGEFRQPPLAAPDCSGAPFRLRQARRRSTRGARPTRSRRRRAHRTSAGLDVGSAVARRHLPARNYSSKSTARRPAESRTARVLQRSAARPNVRPGNCGAFHEYHRDQAARPLPSVARGANGAGGSIRHTCQPARGAVESV